MKKLLVCVLIFTMQTIDSCNKCLGYPYTGQLFRRAALEPVKCDCNCQQQPHVKFEDGYGYGCVVCGHRRLPEDPFEKKPRKSNPENPTWDPASTKIVRWEQAPEGKVLIGQIS